MANIKYKENGEYKDIVVKVGDTTPIGAEIDYEGSVVPDGWEEVTTEEYIANNTYNCRVRKSGKVVHLSLQFRNSSSPIATLNGYSANALGTLPEEYRPNQEYLAPIYARSSSGGTNVIYFAVDTTGAVRFFNWGPALTNVECLCSNITYITD